MLCDCPVLTGSFPLSSSMEQLAPYDEGEMTSQDTPQQPGEALPIADNPSKLPAVVPDGVLDPPPSSFPAGLSGPVPGDQPCTLSTPSSVLTGPLTLDGVEQVPPLPAEPYEDFLHRTNRLSTASSSSGPQPAASDVTMDLVTLPPTLPRPFPTFEGLDQHPRAPAPTAGPGKLLPDRCYIPPPDPWRGPVRAPPFLRFLCPWGLLVCCLPTLELLDLPCCCD